MATWLENHIRSGTKHYPDDFKIEAFVHCEENNKPIRGCIVYGKRQLIWTWQFDLRHFEVIHGLSRIVLLLPDKVHTAIEIQKDNIPEADGSFLVQLVINLANVYRDQLRRKADINCNVTNITTTQIFSHDRAPIVSADRPDNFEDVFVEFLSSLENFKRSLAERNRSDIYDAAEELLRISDDIWICCRVFLDLVHPVWLSIQRGVDWELLPKQQQLWEHLAVVGGGKLINEFLELSSGDFEV